MTPAEYEGACANVAAVADTGWLRSEVAQFEAEERPETVYIRVVRAELAFRDSPGDDTATPAAAPGIAPWNVLVDAKTTCRRCRNPAEWDERVQGWRHTEVSDGVFCDAMFGEWVPR